jgi:hypothetical protein
MKTVILSMIAAFSLNAFADGLVQLRMGGGMPVPGGLRYREITVSHDGEVKVKEGRYPKDFNNGKGSETEFVAGTVEPADLAALEQAAASITGGKLTEPKGPQCMDAPGYSYGVVREGKVVTIFTRFGCRDSQLKDKSQRPAADSIRDYLDQWNHKI